MWAQHTGNRHIRVSVKRTVYAQQQGQCATIDARVCTVLIDEYDHIVNAASTGIPRSAATAADVQGLCAPCHNVKTQAEAAAGGRAKRAKRYRTPLPNPGLAPRPHK